MITEEVKGAVIFTIDRIQAEGAPLNAQSFFDKISLFAQLDTKDIVSVLDDLEQAGALIWEEEPWMPWRAVF